MAYNLYQVQMSKAWVERIEKENHMAEKFWMDQAISNSPKSMPNMSHPNMSHPVERHHETTSLAGSRVTSVAPSGYTSKTTFLKTKLDRLEAELATERQSRKKVEADLQVLRSTTGTPL